MFILVISSPSNPTMPPLSLFTGFPSTGKLYWIQRGSLKKAISATLCKFPIFIFTYQYVILAHFLTVLGLGIFFLHFFLKVQFAWVSDTKQYYINDFPIQFALLHLCDSWNFNFMNFLAFICYMHLMSDTCDIWACSYTVNKGLFQAFVPRSYREKDRIKSV